MARKIAVIDGNRTSTYVKKSVAILLVRRLLAEWVTENLSIRRLAPVASSFLPARIYKPAKPYIPEKMPPAEVSGCHFQEPQSAQWKIDHRLNLAVPRVIAVR